MDQPKDNNPDEGDSSEIPPWKKKAFDNIARILRLKNSLSTVGKVEAATAPKKVFAAEAWRQEFEKLEQAIIEQRQLESEELNKAVGQQVVQKELEIKDLKVEKEGLEIQKESEKAFLRGELVQWVKKSEKISARVIDLERSLAEAEAAGRRAEESLAREADAREKLEKQAREAEAEYKAALSALENKNLMGVAAFLKQEQEYEGALRAKDAEIQKIWLLKRELEQEMSSLRQEMGRRDQALQEQHARIEADHRKELDFLAGEAQAREAAFVMRRQEMEARLGELGQERGLLESELESLKARYEQDKASWLEQAGLQERKLREQAESMERHRQKQLEAERAGSESVEQQRKKILEIEKIKADLQNEKNSLSEQLSVLEQKLQARSAMIEEQRKKLLDVEKANGELQTEKSALAGRLEQLEKSLAASRDSAHAELAEEHRKGQAEIESLKAAIEKEQSAGLERSKRIQELEASAVSSKEALQRQISEEYRKKEAQLESLKEELLKQTAQLVQQCKDRLKS